ncbi:MAG: outer membrane lipoprotein carrier protein LolA [Lentisphaeria bacterium]|nr:outer membrane lipoprotein carrier protein LolA [Lentisphaeria bacterium]
MKHVFLSLFFIGAPLLSQADDTLTSVLKRLEKNMAAVTAVSTEFVQEKEMAVLKRTLTIRGHVHMAGDKFSWIVTAPVSYRMVIEGKKMRQWDGESGKIQAVNLDKNPAFATALSQMRRWFEGDYAAFQPDFTLTLIQSDPVILTFSPIDGKPVAAYLKKITLTFRPDERYIDSIRIDEAGGDSTFMRFENTVINGEIDDEAWQVRP